MLFCRMVVVKSLQQSQWWRWCKCKCTLTVAEKGAQVRFDKEASSWTVMLLPIHQWGGFFFLLSFHFKYLQGKSVTCLTFLINIRDILHALASYSTSCHRRPRLNKCEQLTEFWLRFFFFYINSPKLAFLSCHVNLLVASQPAAAVNIPSLLFFSECRPM